MASQLPLPEATEHLQEMAKLPTYPPAFKAYHPAARSIFGPTPKLDLLLENTSYPFAHEAGVFVPSQNALYITSNQFTHPVTHQTHVTISRLDLPPNHQSTHTTCTEIHAPEIPLANGAVNYNNGILFCAQGTPDREGGIIYMPLDPPASPTPTPLTHPTPPQQQQHQDHSTHSPPTHPPPLTPSALHAPPCTPYTTSFHARPFNSPNDIVPHASGTLLFTDPPYGHEQRIRPRPRLPPHVYAFNPRNHSLRVVADGFHRPNGIALSPAHDTCYVTDTDWIHGDGSTDDTRASTIYAFRVACIAGELALLERRVFAAADVGVPDGIKCDGDGNVYAGCGDGLNVWSPGGVLLAKILIDGGVANFCFGAGATLYLLNETRVWRVSLAEGVKGALLGI